MPLDDLYSMTIDVAYRGVQALVLGGSGFIGAWTAWALHARGATVTVVARDAEHASAALGPAARDARIIAIDLLRSGALAELMDAVQPTIVFNLVGYGVDQSERDPERPFSCLSDDTARSDRPPRRDGSREAALPFAATQRNPPRASP